MYNGDLTSLLNLSCALCAPRRATHGLGARAKSWTRRPACSHNRRRAHNRARTRYLPVVSEGTAAGSGQGGAGASGICCSWMVVESDTEQANVTLRYLLGARSSVRPSPYVVVYLLVLKTVRGTSRRGVLAFASGRAAPELAVIKHARGTRDRVCGLSPVLDRTIDSRARGDLEYALWRLWSRDTCERQGI